MSSCTQRGYRKYTPGLWPVDIGFYSQKIIGWYAKRDWNRWDDNRPIGDKCNWKIFIDKEWKHFEHYLTKNIFYFPKNDIWIENSKLVEYVDDPEKSAYEFMGWNINKDK